jgi:hypothetical protein
MMVTGGAVLPHPDRGACNNRIAGLRYDAIVISCGDRAMADSKKKKFDLGRSGTITCHVSEDARRLLIEFDTDKEGLSKTGVNGLIDALKKIRDKMVR